MPVYDANSLALYTLALTWRRFAAHESLAWKWQREGRVNRNYLCLP